MICKHCKIDKPLTEFYIYKGKKFDVNGKTYYKKDCKVCALKKFKPSAEARRWADFKSNANRRGLEITLTRDEFMSFWSKPCKYCGSVLDRVGLDRLDNSKGYSLDNVVSCCPTCNYMKQRMSEEELYEQCEKILRFNRIVF